MYSYETEKPICVDWDREFEQEMVAEGRMQLAEDGPLERVCAALREYGFDEARAAKIAGITVEELQGWLNSSDEAKLARILGNVLKKSRNTCADFED